MKKAALGAAFCPGKPAVCLKLVVPAETRTPDAGVSKGVRPRMGSDPGVRGAGSRLS